MGLFSLFGSNSEKEAGDSHYVAEPEKESEGFWECFEDSDGDIQLYRKEVPGGWLYVHDPAGSDTVMCFVPFPPKETK